MIRLLIPVGLLLVGWICMLLLSRRNEEKVVADWQTLLSPTAEKTFEHSRIQVETNLAMAGVAMHEAVEVRQLGDVNEALQFLSVGGDIIERFTPSLLSLLKTMFKFSHMVSAIAPIQPLLPHDFHLAKLTRLAHLHRIVHQTLVSAKQRFRLKLYVLGKGVAMTSRYLVQQIGIAVTRRHAAEQEWDEIVKIEHDFQKLSQESIQSFRALVQALSQDGVRQLARDLFELKDSNFSSNFSAKQITATTEIR
jgi:hypothetical protein